MVVARLTQLSEPWIAFLDPFQQYKIEFGTLEFLGFLYKIWACRPGPYKKTLLYPNTGIGMGYFSTILPTKQRQTLRFRMV